MNMNHHFSRKPQQMKQSIYAIAFAGLSLASLAAHASDGVIYVEGEITDQTCDVKGSGGSGHDVHVILPSISASALFKANDTAAPTPFSISLSKCKQAGGGAHTYFEPGPTTLASGNLKTTGDAKNVEIQLLNGDMSFIKAGFADGTQNSATFNIVDNTATLSYYAQYYTPTGNVTTGDVKAQVNFSIIYE
jgi:major type 1 subunit fimbrin (pilin)